MLACGPATPAAQGTSASAITPTPITVPFNQGTTRAKQQAKRPGKPNNFSADQQVDRSAQATVEAFTGRPLRTDADLAREFKLKDELCAALDDAATFRRWARRAHLERGNSAQYSIAAGWGAMTAVHGLNQAESVLYSTYCTRRSMFNDTQEVAWATAVGVVEDNLAWIESGDYKTITTAYATPWEQDNEENNSIRTRTPESRAAPTSLPTSTPKPSPTPTVYEATCDNPTLGSRIWDGTQWDCEYYRDNQEAMKTERHPSPWYYWQIRCDDVPYEQYVRNHCAGAAKASEIPVPTHYTHWDRLCNNTNPGIDTAKLPLPAPVHSGHRQEMIACSIYYDYRDQMPEKMPDSNLMLWSYNKCYEVDEGSDTPQAYLYREWKANMYWANVTPRQLP